MKTVFAFLIALGMTLPFASAAFAGPDECADGQTWDEDTQSCVDN